VLPVPFRGGVELAGREARDVSGAEDLGLLVRDHADVPDLLRRIGAVYPRMGPPAAGDEQRLAACRASDLHWARTRHAERAAELRATSGD
jgi:hypothetical protein